MSVCPKELDRNPNKPEPTRNDGHEKVEDEVAKRVALCFTCHVNCPFQERKNIKARVRGPYGFELVFGIIRILEFFFSLLKAVHSIVDSTRCVSGRG